VNQFKTQLSLHKTKLVTSSTKGTSETSSLTVDRFGSIDLPQYLSVCVLGGGGDFC